MTFLQLLVSTFFLFAPHTAYASTPTPQVLLDIAQCESGQQQYVDGKVLISKTNDYGIFQINSSHLKEAKAMGYDITTEAGNVAYAIYLYNTQGTAPWRSSEACWSSSP